MPSVATVHRMKSETIAVIAIIVALPSLMAGLALGAATLDSF